MAQKTTAMQNMPQAGMEQQKMLGNGPGRRKKAKNKPKLALERSNVASDTFGRHGNG